LAKDVTVRTLTASEPLVANFEHQERLNLPASMIDDAKSVAAIIQRLGVVPAYTCKPHFIYDLRKGEHVAFTESNVAMFANSWFGAMTNIEGATTALASAITGKTPEYGLHLPENRQGGVLIEVDPELEPDKFDYADYVALAGWAGKVLGDRVAVYSGLSKSMGSGHAKYMCASQIYQSPPGIFHIVGVTPEAPTIEAAFAGRMPRRRFLFGRKERESVYAEFCSATKAEVDAVCIGCPHCTMDEIWKVARLLKGRKVNDGVRLLIGASRHVRDLASRMGLIDVIEGAGGLVLTDVCTRCLVLPPASDALGIGVVASTSASAAGNVYRRSAGRSTAWFGTTEDCIEAAVTGRWESE
jgi:hypothetical protein